MRITVALRSPAWVAGRLAVRPVPQPRSRLGVARSSLDTATGPVRAWLDLTAILSEGGKQPTVSAFAEALGKNVYMDIQGWHLSLEDAKLAPGLAAALAAATKKGEPRSRATLDAVLARVPVRLGARTTLPLLELLPERCIGEVEALLERYEWGQGDRE